MLLTRRQGRCEALEETASLSGLHDACSPFGGHLSILKGGGSTAGRQVETREAVDPWVGT